ncbi:MAG: beta-galactosidase [Propionicimonas sp.]
MNQPRPIGHRVGNRILFGAAYYPEYLDHERLDEDFGLMAEAGYSFIRVGESVWSTWEPSDGVFDLEWLEPVLDGAHAHGLSAILGMPTYAIPPWLMIAHPDLASELATDRPVPWGSRQEVDTSHPVFRRYAERVVRRIVSRYAGHPAVVGFQVDNEPGQRLAHNESRFAEFRRWLLAEHGSVEALNRNWNLAHWAHRLRSIDELWRPDGNLVPQYDLAWRRFHAERTTDYISWLRQIVRDHASADQFITTCIDTMAPAVHDGVLAEQLDLVSANQYLATQSELAGDVIGDYAFPPSGSWAPFYAGDRAYGMRQERYLITETNATSIGFPWFNFPPYDGQLRQFGWALIARGARALGYWHWHTMHASWESSWGGILPHSLRPGRTYAEVARLGREIASVGGAIESLVPDAGVGLVFSMPSRWAFEFHPPLQDPTADPRKQGGPDRAAYERILYRFYGGLSRAGHQVRLWHSEQLVKQDPAATAATLPVLVVPALVLVSDRLAAWLRDYATAGGHLVLGVRTASADEHGRIRDEPQPAGLAGSAGVWYEEFSNLVSPIRVTGGLVGAAELLIEGLVTTEATPVAWYEHPHFGRWPALTTNECGAGRVSYLGMVPDLELATSLGRWLWRGRAKTHPWRRVLVPGVVQVHGATNGRGERLWFIHHFSEATRRVAAPLSVHDLVNGNALIQVGDQIELEPWDVRVLRAAG